MLQVIDAEAGGFLKADGAQMAGDLQPPGVRGLDGGLELVAAQRHVGLERRRALIGPGIDVARDARGIRRGRLRVEVWARDV